MTLDIQVEYLDEKSLQAFGHWLCRKWQTCQQRQSIAQAELDKLTVADDVLRACWADQVKEQTKPAPRALCQCSGWMLINSLASLEGQSRNKGKQTVETILALQKSLDIYKKEVADLETTLCGSTQSVDIGEVTLQLHDTRAKISQLSIGIHRHKAALGVSGQAVLSKMKNNEFFRVKMNAHALKTRLRDRLRQRKFELEKLERSYRQAASSELRNHFLLKASTDI
jgi:hypothetical protein